MFNRYFLALTPALRVFFLVPLLLAGCGGGNNGPTLTSVEVTPSTASIANGTTQPFVATAIYSNGTKTDVTQSVVWSSSDTQVASISNVTGSQGVASALALGNTTVTATYGGKVIGTAQLTVTAATITSLAVTPSTVSIANGTTQAFVAVATFTDNTHQTVTTGATWSSSAPTVATISNASGSNGVAQSLTQGTTTITATYMGQTATAALTVAPASLVSVAVSPSAPSIANGTTQAFTATATFTDSSHQNVTAGAIWGSSNPTVASISNTSGSNGLAQSLAQGTTTITVSYMGQSGTATLTVTPAVLASLTVTPANPTVAVGLAQAFIATGTYTDNSQQNLTQSVIWTSSDSSVATISNAAGSNGQAATLAVGTTTIGAASGTIQATTTLTVSTAVLTSISVTPANPSVPLGTTQQLTATGIYSDNSHQDLTTTVTWASSNTGTATVSNATGSQGLVAAEATGATTISATSGSISGSTGLTVTGATLVSLQVTPASSNLAAGFNLQYTATGIYSDNSNRNVTSQVTWLSTNSNAATVSNASGSEGLAVGINAGSTTITAQSGSISGSANLTVTSATLSSISVTPSSISVPDGTTQQYTATGTFSDNSVQDLTSQVAWSSSATAVATINPNGLAVAIAASGTSTIMATSVTSPSGTISGSATLTATSAALTSIAISPSTASIPSGTTQIFTAQGQYSDGTSADVTQQVTWSSSNSAVATISNASGSQGVAQGASPGSVTITATSPTNSAVTATAALTVSNAVLTSVSISPVNDSVAEGIAVQYTATGTYSDASTKDLSTSVTWSSSSASVASISNAAGSQGIASTTQTGTTTIGAVINNATGSPISDSTSLTVTTAVLQKIILSPANATIGSNSSQPFTATGTYSDNSTANLTTQVTWSSSNTAVADISNSSGSQGLAVGKTQGAVTITAVDPASSVSGQTSLTVGPAALQSISISPPASGDGQAPVGFNKQFQAIGHYADGSTQDLTDSVTWTSFDPSVLTVSNTAGTQGVVTGVSPGTAIITAQNGQISANKTVTVTNATVSSISVTPANATLSGSGKTQQYAAVATFSDGEVFDVTTQVTWSSSNTSAATISNTAGSQGLATSKLELVTTTTTISAVVNGVTGSTTLSVAL